jgi:DNA-binding transcriptional LysR family regulator
MRAPSGQRRRGVRTAVVAGLGLAIASEWLFGPELESANVEVVRQDSLLPPVDLLGGLFGRLSGPGLLRTLYNREHRTELGRQGTIAQCEPLLP